MTEPLLHIDYEGFARELDALREDVDQSLGPEDLAHMRKMERWGQTCTALGYATAWMLPNPVSMVLLSTGSMARWTICMHHLGHKGLDKVPGAPERYTSRAFARGNRRWLDWLDWMDPEAWLYEHNVLHHYHTGEVTDPDLVEENTRKIREAKLPLTLKYVAVGFYALTWKFTYYAPNTFQILRRAEQRRQERKSAAENESSQRASVARGAETYLSVFDFRTEEGRAYWKRCLLPYGLSRFVAVPALFSPLGPWSVFSVWANTVGAELLANLHTFMIIAPNHAGEDMYRFDRPTKDRAEFYVRQVLGSVNYATGGDLRDFLQGYLNYQIEHHLFPDLPPRQYQRIQPKVKALCERYGIPYVQESIFRRVRKLVAIMVGERSMREGKTLSRSERKTTEPNNGSVAVA